MKILFVNCVNFLESALPEGIAVLSSILKDKGHEVDIFDTAFIRPGGEGRKRAEGLPERLAFHKSAAYSLRDLTANEPEADVAREFRKKIDEFKPSLIAVSAMTTNYQQSISLIKNVKPDCSVAVGGVHATLMPESAIKDEGVDFVCVGEGDEALPELCERLQDGRDPSDVRNLYIKEKGTLCNVTKNSLRPFVNLDSLPVPDIGLFDERHLFRPFVGNIYKGIFMSTSRGCPRGCAYCVNNELRNIVKECGKRYIRFQSPKIVARNLKTLRKEHGINWFKFSDDTFLTRPLRDMYELRDLLKDADIMFGCSVDPATVTKEKVSLVREMGCVSMSIGIETGDEGLRKSVLKRNISNGQIKNAVKILRDHDIKISAFNMIGLPGETKKDVYTTIRLNKELEIPDANVYIVYPYPGTEIYRRANITLEKYGAIPHMDEAYLFNLSEISRADLLFFLKAFNLFLVLPENQWGRIEEARKDPELYAELVSAAQESIDNNNVVKSYDTIS